MTVISRTRDFIVAGCDSRVVLWGDGGYESLKCRKFAIGRRRNVLFLISGTWQGIKKNPRLVLERDVEELVNEEDSVYDVARKAYEHLLPLYPKTGGRGWQLQVCGFDSGIAKVYVVLSNPPPHRKTIEEVLNGAVTGTEGVFAFTKKRGVPPIGSLCSNESEMIALMKNYMLEAVRFENEWSTRRNRPHMTDSRINILVVRPDVIEWKEPRYYYPKDEKRLERMLKRMP